MAGKRTITEIPPAKTPLFTPAKLKACAYVRVSTEHTGQMNSLKNQSEYYEKLLNKNPFYENCGIFSDTGISGAKENRPGFNTMMEKARAGELDLIMTKTISRFARNTVLLLKYVRELKEVGVAIIFEEQKINTLSSEGELMLTVLGAIAEEERKSVSSNVKIAIRSKYKLGGSRMATNNLLGYDKDTDGKIIIDETQAKIVRKIFRLYLSGVLPEHIAEQLNSEGVPSYTHHDATWNYHRIRRILSNEKYIGDCCQSKYYSDDFGKVRHNRGELPMFYITNNHEPIIPRADWEQVQIIMSKRKKVVRPFTSKLKCPRCGASLHRHSRDYCDLVDWVCGTYLTKRKKACDGVRIPEEALDKLTTDLLPLKEPYVVLEVNDVKNNNKRKTEENFRLAPLSQYRRGCGTE